MLRYAQKRRFSQHEQKRIESEIGLQTYLKTLIQNDKERRMQNQIEKYLEENENSSMTNVNIEGNRPIDSQLEKVLREIELSAEQSLNEMNNLFNEVDMRRKRREIPEYLTCKLCYDLMRDPVITPCEFFFLSMKILTNSIEKLFDFSSWDYVLSFVYRRKSFQSRTFRSDRQQTFSRRTTRE